jgi:hypothetical protein
MIDTDLFQEGDLVGAARRADDGAAFQFGNLCNHGTNRTCRARHEHHITRLERGHAHQTGPCCQPGHADRAEKKLFGQAMRIKLLHMTGISIECLAPAVEGLDQIADFQKITVRRNDLADRATLHCFTKLE